MKGTTMVYLALVILVLMMLYAKSEGFEMPTYSGDRWLGLSNWYTSSPSTTTRDKPTTTITTGNTGTGISGRKYETTTDTSNDLTSTEKSTSRSALNKLIAQNEGNEVLISCINKVKAKL